MQRRARIKHKLRPFTSESGVKRLCPHCALPVHKSTFYRHKAENFVRRTQKWMRAPEWRHNAEELRSDPRWGEPAFAMIQAWLKADVQHGDFEHHPLWRSEVEELEEAAHQHIRRRVRVHSEQGKYTSFCRLSSLSVLLDCHFIDCIADIVDYRCSERSSSSSSSDDPESSSDSSDDDGAGIFSRPVFRDDRPSISSELLVNLMADLVSLLDAVTFCSIHVFTFFREPLTSLAPCLFLSHTEHQARQQFK